MGAAAGALGVPDSVLRQVKKLGADGFAANGNVDIYKVVRWLLTKGHDFVPAMSLEEARAELTLEKVRSLRYERAISGGELIPVGKVMGFVDSEIDSVKKTIEGFVVGQGFMIWQHGRDEQSQNALKSQLREVADYLKMTVGGISGAVQFGLKRSVVKEP